jgi:pyridoxamine 5'-phosphate oxidase
MRPYKHLSEKSVNPDPFLQFDKWFREHLTSGIDNPNAFSLATASRGGDVSVRTVLLKEYTGEGFVFFTNYLSKKGKQLASNNRVAMLFYWPEKGRQVRIEGIAGKISAGESYKYFSSRPRESRTSAWASEQSSPIPDKDFLLRRFKEFRDKFSGKSIPLPPQWGGFRIIPAWFEFWQDGRHRLHDRITYTASDDGWIIGRLSP